MSKLTAYHNDPATKDHYLAQVRMHKRADQITQGQYWDNDNETGTFRGCAVGCTIHSANHSEYETKLGVPMMLAYLEDRIFEGLPSKKLSDDDTGVLCTDWPELFLSAIPVGADLSLVGFKTISYLMDEMEPLITTQINLHATDQTRPSMEQCKAAVIRVKTEVTDPLSRGETVSEETAAYAARVADAAYAAAYAASVAYAARVAYAAYAVADAAYAAAYAARVAYAAYAVADAAYAAAYAARVADAAYAAYAARVADAAYAAASVADAAYAVACAADAATSAASVADAADAAAYARYNFYRDMAKRLLEFLAAAPIPEVSGRNSDEVFISAEAELRF